MPLDPLSSSFSCLCRSIFLLLAPLSRASLSHHVRRWNMDTKQNAQLIANSNMTLWSLVARLCSDVANLKAVPSPQHSLRRCIFRPTALNRTKSVCFDCVGRSLSISVLVVLLSVVGVVLRKDEHFLARRLLLSHLVPFLPPRFGCSKLDARGRRGGAAHADGASDERRIGVGGAARQRALSHRDTSR